MKRSKNHLEKLLNQEMCFNISHFTVLLRLRPSVMVDNDVVLP